MDPFYFSVALFWVVASLFVLGLVYQKAPEPKGAAWIAALIILPFTTFLVWPLILGFLYKNG